MGRVFAYGMEVPKEANAQVVVVVPVGMVVVDVETVVVEIADIDAVAVGVEIFARFRPFSPESLKF